MTISKLRCTCKSCAGVFDAEIVTDAPVEVAVASMKAVRCPKCGSDKCGMGGAYNDAPALTASIKDRLDWWLERGERGVSSDTIYSAFTSSAPRHGADIPYDPDDYSRCRALFDLIPEWRKDLSPLVARYPWYKPVADNWDEMDRLWNEEIGDRKKGSAPKLYALMQRLGAESRKLRKVQS